MVNADNEVGRSRRLLETAKEIRDRNRKIMKRLQSEIERSKKLQAESRWMRYFQHDRSARDFFRQLDDQCKPEKGANESKRQKD